MHTAAADRKRKAAAADDDDDVPALAAKCPALVSRRPALVNRPAIAPHPNPSGKTAGPRMHGGSARGRLMLSSIGAVAPPTSVAPAPTSAVRQITGPTSGISAAGSSAAPPAPSRATPSKPLPERCQRVLDTFIAIESALPLLRKRDVPPLYGMLRKPVEDLTGFEFPPELLAGLVHACPTAFRVSARDVALTEERLRLSATPRQKVDWLIEQTAAPTAPPPAPLADGHAKGDPEAMARDDRPPPPMAPPLAPPKAAAPMPSRVQVAEWRQAQRAELVAVLEAHSAQHGDAPLPLAALPPLETPKTKAEAKAKAEAEGWARAETADPEQGVLPADTVAGTAARAPAGGAGAGPKAPEAPMPMAVPVGCEGLPAELLRRVMQRQAEARVLIETQPKLQRAALLKRLPEMAMATRECMFEARRRLMPQPDLVRRLLQNAKWISSTAELEAQLQLLTEIVPQWISLVRLGDDEDLTVRLDEDVSFSEVQKAIKAARNSV